jgi:hypothetical protein
MWRMCRTGAFQPSATWTFDMSSAQKEPDVPVAGPILTGPAVPHVPQADTNQSFLAEVYEEVGSESFSAWIEAVGERTSLPTGCAVMFFTALDYVVNDNPLRWKVAAIGFFFAILGIWARFFIEEGAKAGYVKAVAVTRSKLESPSSVALLHTAVDRNVESNASLGNGIVAIILALALAYDFKMLLVVGILGFIAIEGAVEGIRACERGVRATQKTAGYDITSPNKSVAETSAQAIEAAVQKHRRLFTLSSVATIVAAMAIRLTNKPVSSSGITCGEFQAVRMLPAILSVMLGISFLQEAMATGSEAARLVAIVDGELLKLEREELCEQAKRAGDHAAFVFERQLEVEVQTAQRKVNDCSAAVKVDEDEESALMRRVENAMQVLEHAKLQYNSAHAALATHLLQ